MSTRLCVQIRMREYFFVMNHHFCAAQKLNIHIVKLVLMLNSLYTLVERLLRCRTYYLKRRGEAKSYHI